jgi:iron only hydrogenase large subunit-like protein
VWQALEDPDRFVVVQTAPATRVALGEEFGLPPGTWVMGKQVAALRRLGFDAVLDTNFTADLRLWKKRRN